MSKVAALVLAAGLGRRFGEAPKLLAQWKEQPLVRHAASAAVDSRAVWTGVVTGHRSGDVAAALAGLPVVLVSNPNYAEGLSTSLKAGFAALPSTAGAVVVLLGDMPGISPALIDALIVAWEAERPIAVVPTLRGRRGNPVLLSRALAPCIAALSGDTGAGLLLRTLSGVCELPLHDEALAWDVDTPDALRSARASKR